MAFTGTWSATVTMTAGTVFLMWIGEQIDAYGIGNGISLLIMSGILARMPKAAGSLLAARVHQGRRVGDRQRNRKVAAAGGAVCGRDCVGRRHHARPAADSHSKRQARARTPRDGRAAAIAAVASQSGRRDADHFCFELADVPDVHLPAAEQPFHAFGVLAGRGDRVRRRTRLRLQHVLRGADLLLLLFLDGHHVQSQGYGGQPEGLRQLHSRAIVPVRERPPISSR